MARIISTTGASSVVHDGKEYRPNRQGVFSVPNEVAEDLRAHGFVPAGKSQAKAAASAED
jgi:hypothetical protein